LAKVSFKIRATASRVERGLLAIPRKFSSEFPPTKSQILIAYDDGTRTESKAFSPYETKDNEARIFGLRGWYSKRKIGPGDIVTITVEDRAKGIYRVASDRYVQERREIEARRDLYKAESVESATQQLRSLAAARKRKPQSVAFEEITRLAAQPIPLRARRHFVQSGRPEAVPASIRTLLEAVYEGRCQICGFTFQKRDGSPYFELHHIEPNKGHHPTNLLVVCANCHASLEQAFVGRMDRVMNWPIAVTINGKRRRIRQPFVQRRIPALTMTLTALCLAIRLATYRAL
jgi:HNH endonuclease